MKRLRNGILGVCAALTAGAAQAQGEAYAKVGPWDVVADPGRNLCEMHRYYDDTVDHHRESLAVRYDAAKEAVWLGWSTNGKTLFFQDGQIDLFLSFFVKGKAINKSWGSRTFRHAKPQDTRFFINVVDGPGESPRMLRDLAASELIGLYLGPSLLTSLSLNASEATETLRECSLKAAAHVAPGAVLK